MPRHFAFYSVIKTYLFSNTFHLNDFILSVQKFQNLFQHLTLLLPGGTGISKKQNKNKKQTPAHLECCVLGITGETEVLFTI